MATKSLAVQRDNTSRRAMSGTAARAGRGDNAQLIVGKVDFGSGNRRVRSFLRFDLSGFWDTVNRVTEAYIDLVIDGGPVPFSATNPSAKILVLRATESWSEGSDTDWDLDSYRWPSLDYNNKVATRLGAGSGGDVISLDVKKVLRLLAPKNVQFSGMGAGRAKSNHGFALLASPESDGDNKAKFFSGEYGTPSSRPMLRIVYDEIGEKPVGGLTLPSGASSLGFTPSGSWTDADAIEYLTRARFQVRKDSAGDWDNPIIDWSVDLADGLTADATTFSITNIPDSKRAKLNVGQTYECRVKLWDSRNLASDWSSANTFTITAVAPTVSLDALPEEADGHTPLEGLVLNGDFTTDADAPALLIDVQVTGSQDGKPKWAFTHVVSQAERDEGRFHIPWGGPALAKRLFTIEDPLVVLGIEPSFPATVGTKALTIPDGTKAIVGVTLNNQSSSGWSLGGVPFSGASSLSVWGYSESVFWALDIDSRTNDTLTIPPSTGKDPGLAIAALVYVGGNDVSLVEGGIDTSSPTSVVGTPTKGGNVLVAVAGGTIVVGCCQPFVSPGIELINDTGSPRLGAAGYALSSLGASAQVDINHNEQSTYVVLQADPAQTGHYDISLTIRDSLSGTASDSNVEALHIYRDIYTDEGDLELTTGFSNVRPAQRILIYSMDTSNRGRKKVVGIIEDAADIGVSWYASAPGEIYFTLPTTHAQVSVIEPMTTHYEYQQYRRGRWVSLAYGLMRDFDATDEEVVFYGIDYLGLLSYSVEKAFQPGKNPDRNIPKAVGGSNGARYFKKPIRKIIVDQLKRAIKQESQSPVKFIKIGRVDNFNTKITIYASFAERLSFIRGLIESHKGGQANGAERRSRIRVRYDPNAANGNGRFKFDVLDNVGKDRDNLRLEYGGLIQGYQVIALDDFATKVYGIGTQANKVKPHFYSEAAPGISLGDWGTIGRANMWADIVDKKDLKRRVRALGSRLSRIGKRIALGIRVRSIDPFDGYDLLDSFPIDIDDGVVDTSQYGSGYWTLWGVNYRVYRDEHDEVTFILRPKGTTDSIDSDLIDSEPENRSSDWAWGSGPPSGEVL